MIITAYQLPALYEQKRVSIHEMEEIVRLLAQAPLLYDDGQRIQVQDYMGGLEVELEHEVRRAVTQLYELAVQACRAFLDPFAYEQFQDVLGLQAELWQEEVLTLAKWMDWLKQISEGKKTLPEYNFTAMLGNLPDGFMIHDFYDELRYQLEQKPANTWALKERDRLYASLGVK